MDRGVSGVNGNASTWDGLRAIVRASAAGGVAVRWGVGGARGKVFGGISAHGLEWEELVGELTAQECGCLAEGVGRGALFAEGAEAKGVVAFGKADAGGVGDERAVVEGR